MKNYMDYADLADKEVRDKRDVLDELTKKGVILNLEKIQQYNKYYIGLSLASSQEQFRPPSLFIIIGDKNYSLPNDLYRFILDQIQETEECNKVIINIGNMNIIKIKFLKKEVNTRIILDKESTDLLLINYQKNYVR